MESFIRKKYDNNYDTIMIDTLMSPYIFYQIGSFLDHRDLKRFSLTAHCFHELVNSEEFLIHKCGELLNIAYDIINNYVTRRIRVLLEIEYSNKDAVERLNLLGQTICDISCYIVNSNKTNCWIKYSEKSVFIILLESLQKQLNDVYETLVQIHECVTHVTVNFDIFELSLRKLYYEMRTLFPIKIQNYTDNFASHIRDEESRMVWETTFGKNCAAVSINVFFEQVVHSWKNGTNVLFKKYLEHLFNFPRDDIITVFRFHTMACLYGPYNKIPENFNRFVMKENSGFVGLMNTVGAEQLLTQLLPSLEHNTVLIRFSRREPEMFAFTSVNITTRRFEHRRNITTSGKIIPIDEYISLYFPGYVIAKLDLDPECVHIKNTATFSRVKTYMIHSGYIHRD